MKTIGIRMRGLALILSVLSLIPLAIVVPHYVRAAIAASPACATVGIYNVKGGAAAGGASSGKTPQVLPPGSWPGYLSGTVTVTAYTGCGAPTAGRFQVHVTRTAGPVPGPSSSSGATHNATGAAIPIPFSGTTVISATGTFQQDPAHSANAEYVLVSATVHYGVRGIRCINVCPETGSHPSIACLEPPCSITGMATSRVVSFRNVTGYLLLQQGKPAIAGLMFLPPPDPHSSVSAALAPAPVSFWGTKTS